MIVSFKIFIMLKTRILYQWNTSSKGEIIDNTKGKSIKINYCDLIYFIQIVSTKPMDLLGEKNDNKI